MPIIASLDLHVFHFVNHVHRVEIVFSGCVFL